MALPQSVRERFHNSFTLNESNEVCIRSCVFIEGGSIEATPAGLTQDFTITTITVGDTASALPSTALTDRNSISIFNGSTTDTLYIGKSSVTADFVLGTTSGWQVGPQETLNLDVRDTITVYGIAETGKTLTVQLFEVA